MSYIERSTGATLKADPSWNGTKEAISFVISHKTVEGIIQAKKYLSTLLEKVSSGHYSQRTCVVFDQDTSIENVGFVVGMQS